MASRFPELTIANPKQPTPADIESGTWCAAGLEPDESAVTMLDSTQSAVEAFNAMEARYVWLENSHQTVVAVTGPHSNTPSASIYKEIERTFPDFVQATEGRSRKLLHEGRRRREGVFWDEPEQVIREHSDVVYVQKLAYDHAIPARSAEPAGGADALAVMRHRPELSRAVRTYLIARMLPQAYRRCQRHSAPNDTAELDMEAHGRPPASADATTKLVDVAPTSVPNYLMQYVRAQTNDMDRADYDRLYSPDPVLGAGSISTTVAHLRTVHNIDVSLEDMSRGVEDEALSQLFLCTNSPVYTTSTQSTEALCDLQKVSVLVNRLRDRRTMTHLAELALGGSSVYWTSGPLHFEVGQRALRQIAHLCRLKPR